MFKDGLEDTHLQSRSVHDFCLDLAAQIKGMTDSCGVHSYLNYLQGDGRCHSESREYLHHHGSATGGQAGFSRTAQTIFLDWSEYLTAMHSDAF